jgi:tRNA uridine 5-carboxymethylaminomethyl modification enzyme
MFTSRAEFRLQLREDNADLRLTETGRRLGLIDDARWAAFNRKREGIERETQRLKSTWVHPHTVDAADAVRLLGKALEHEYSLMDLLRRPGVTFDAVAELAQRAQINTPVSRETLTAEWGASLSTAIIEQIEIGTKYAGYIDKQIDEVARAAHFENLPLPADLDYAQVHALSFEVRQTLARQRPATLGLASRLSGVTPAAISLLLVHLKKRRRGGADLASASVQQADAA